MPPEAGIGVFRGSDRGGSRVTVSDSTVPPKNSAALAILVVDDEPLIRWSLRKALTNRGHRVVEAGAGAQALALIAADPAGFDVVILDYRLPDRQDLSLLRDVRQLVPDGTVLMMTAYGDAAMRAEALVIGARAVVDKPFQVSELVALVESARVP
jgi:two-component system, NtrC family, response regulator AtoC